MSQEASLVTSKTYMDGRHSFGLTRAQHSKSSAERSSQETSGGKSGQNRAEMDAMRVDTVERGFSAVGCSSDENHWRFGEEGQKAELPRLASEYENGTTKAVADVEELARLIKDNLTAKHFVLSLEELLVEFLECPMSEEDTLVLEPMHSYQRMLLHRLADLFGLAHESFGEGDERHVVVQKCEESLIPAVLVSDVLEHTDGGAQPAQSYRQLLKRHTVPSDGLHGQTLVSSPGLSLEERQAAYLAARQKIFSQKWRHTDQIDITQGAGHARPRSDPIVARRMIAHALGKPRRLNVPNPVAEARTPQDQPGGHSTPTQGKQMTQETREAMHRASVKAAKRMFANALGSELSGSSTRSAVREVPCKTTDSPCVSLVEENDFSVLPPTDTGTRIPSREINASTSGVAMKGNVSIISSQTDDIVPDNRGKVTKSPTKSEMRPARHARPGVAACRIFTQALGLPDSVSSEVGRSPAAQRGGSLTSN
ncbi:hypothetical protein R1flu_003147 [Riccia fluitans]|uniref:R3H domain-containing protein n=1 Tax=Riccia fluitans TaxID=41844 RepID=A0ABD1YB67_9MARC